MIVGRGGREHALAWKISSSPHVQEVWVAPGNAGMEDVALRISLDENDFQGILRFVEEKEIHYVVVGPEAPLAGGIVDFLRAHGIKAFGPVAAAARIESSKIFAKNLMRKYHVPTAGFFTADDIQQAKTTILQNPDRPYVIKADGLAAGKGVVICQDGYEAIQVVEEFITGRKFGEASSRVVVEELLRGEEASVFVLTDGENYVLLPPAQDYKRVYDNDQGPNTGGMGAYAPAPLIGSREMNEIEHHIVRPILQGLKKEGFPFQGCLYCGLMVTGEGIKVIEFNCRFGDPETQVVLPLIETDLFPILQEIADGKLNTGQIRVKSGYAVSVVLASGGYPEAYEKGKEIKGTEALRDSNHWFVFHAGTDRKEGRLVTNGGRVLNIVGLGPTLESAIQTAYNGVEKIHFENMHYRKDIGQKGLKYFG